MAKGRYGRGLRRSKDTGKDIEGEGSKLEELQVLLKVNPQNVWNPGEKAIDTRTSPASTVESSGHLGVCVLVRGAVLTVDFLCVYK